MNFEKLAQSKIKYAVTTQQHIAYKKE